MTTEERLEVLERELARTKRRNRWLLAGLVLCLGALVVVWATQGRYALSSMGTFGVYVLDTRTGQLWVRYSDNVIRSWETIYLGTNDDPKKEPIKKE